MRTRLEPVSDPDALTDEWAALAARAGNPFATPQLLGGWWRAMGGDARLELWAARRPDGSLLAVLPLHVTRSRSLRELRFLGHGLADVLGPVCAPGDTAAAGSALREALHVIRGYDLFVGEGLPAGDGWPQRVRGRAAARHARPVVRIDGRSWDELLGSWSANLRQQVRKRERRLRREHDVRVRVSQDPARLAGDLEAFIDLHERRFGAASRMFAGPARAFHHQLAADALAGGWLRLMLLELDGRPAAGFYGFRYGGTEWFWNQGRDPAFEHDRVGFVMTAIALREACEAGMRTFDFLLGDEPYKRRFADADLGLVRVVRPGGPAGRAALALSGARRVLRRRRAAAS